MHKLYMVWMYPLFCMKLILAGSLRLSSAQHSQTWALFLFSFPHRRPSSAVLPCMGEKHSEPPSNGADVLMLQAVNAFQLSRLDSTYGLARQAGVLT